MLTAVLNVNGAAFSSTWALKSALYNMSHLLNHTTTFSTLKRLKHTHTKNQTPKQNKKPTENIEVQGCMKKQQACPQKQTNSPKKFQQMD